MAIRVCVPGTGWYVAPRTRGVAAVVARAGTINRGDACGCGSSGRAARGVSAAVHRLLCAVRCAVGQAARDVEDGAALLPGTWYCCTHIILVVRGCMCLCC